MTYLRPDSPIGRVVRVAILALAVATGWIHLTLGGALFTLNGLGYLAAAGALVVPIPLAIRYRWLVRLGLIGYAGVTILGWVLMGPRYDVAYAAKAIEVALIVLLGVEVVASDGCPIPRLQRMFR